MQEQLELAYPTAKAGLAPALDSDADDVAFALFTNSGEYRSFKAAFGDCVEVFGTSINESLARRFWKAGRRLERTVAA